MRIGTDGDDGWRMRHGRLMRECDCSDWAIDGDALITPGTLHTRERVAGAPVEICYHANRNTQVITILHIRTMEPTTDG